MNPPVPYPVAHYFRSFVADTGSEVSEKLTIAILGSPGAEGITQKIPELEYLDLNGNGGGADIESAATRSGTREGSRR